MFTHTATNLHQKAATQMEEKPPLLMQTSCLTEMQHLFKTPPDTA